MDSDTNGFKKPTWPDILSEKIEALKEALAVHQKDEREWRNEQKRCKAETEQRLRDLEHYRIETAQRHRDEDENKTMWKFHIIGPLVVSAVVFVLTVLGAIFVMLKTN